MKSLPTLEVVHDAKRDVETRWRGRLWWIVNKLDLIVGLLLAAAPVWWRFALSGAPAPMPLDFLDGSWVADISYKATQGIWLGRDVVFTYGPAFEWFESLVPRAVGLSVGTVLKTQYILPGIAAVILLYAVVRLLLKEAAAWKRALCVAVAAVFWIKPDLRLLIATLVLALLVRINEAAVQGRRPGLTKALAISALLTVAFLYSADTGVYSVAAVMLTTTSYAFFHRQDRRVRRAIVRFGAQCLAIFVMWVFVVNAAMASPMDFRFWKDSYQVVSVYRWLMPAPIDKPTKHLMFQVIGTATAVVALAWWRRDAGAKAITRHPAFVVAGYAFAFIALQSGLVRSDTAHVALAIVPIMLVSLLVIAGMGEPCPNLRANRARGGWSTAWGTVLLLCVVTLVAVRFTPNPNLRPAQVWQNWTAAPSPICPPEMREFQRACLPPAQFAMVNNVADYLRGHVAADKPIVVFPYENLFGMIAGRRVAGGVLQNYGIGGEYLTCLQIDTLEREKAPAALYFADGEGSVGIDGIANFSRTPEVWFYLQSHYAKAAAPGTGIAALKRDERRQSKREIIQIAGPGQFEVRRRSFHIDLGVVNWPAGADFLKLEVTASYPWWWKLAKPSRFIVEVELADGSIKKAAIVLPPNERTNLWVYPWSDAELSRYFEDDSTRWRDAGRMGVTRLGIQIAPLDQFSATPKQVIVRNVEAVALHGGPGQR